MVSSRLAQCAAVIIVAAGLASSARATPNQPEKPIQAREEAPQKSQGRPGNGSPNTSAVAAKGSPQAIASKPAPEPDSGAVARRETERREDEVSSQRVSATAARRGVWLSLIQIAIGGVGTILIWQTLRATRAAVTEAGGATAAALEAVDETRIANGIAQKQFEAGYKPQLRVTIAGPVVDVKENPMTRFGDDEQKARWTPIYVTVAIENIGTIPATIIYSHVGAMDVTPPGDGNFIGSFGPDELHSVVAPGEIFKPLSHSTIGQSSRHRDGWDCAGGFMLTPENRDHYMIQGCIIRGVLRYLDPIGKVRELGFAFKPGQIWSGETFLRWGGETMNYDREI